MVDLANIQKYANIVIAVGGAIAILYAGAVWVPATFMTKGYAEDLHTKASDDALKRDRELNNSIVWNYLETQISLNKLVLQAMQQRLDNPLLAGEERLHLEIEFDARKKGQALLILQRDERQRAKPVWVQ